MKFKNFQRIEKPVYVLVFFVALASAGIVAVDMWSNVYRDRSVHGTVGSIDGSVVTFTDGRVFDTPIDDIGTYCQPGTDIRVDTRGPTTVWCNQIPLSVNTIDEFS